MQKEHLQRFPELWTMGRSFVMRMQVMRPEQALLPKWCRSLSKVPKLSSPGRFLVITVKPDGGAKGQEAGLMNRFSVMGLNREHRTGTRHDARRHNSFILPV
ncbi:hypothetical protein P73_3758 [Celeribacter indicus]|uniref:Uncharacterized protein n=1 Tax=Celeribacter indicus TaxID=1208324 RepID=A0A0B5DYE4_9RHOB|nr:hypothetical protein P73_3758 [Celeribacter indicus]